MTVAGPIDLRADCPSCAGLCCVAPAFAASADFAIDKDPGEACPNLELDFRCGIHAGLRDAGFPGCVAYDCFGAGQQVTQVTFEGRTWRTAPDEAATMFDAFAVMRALHELAWYLSEALAMPAAARSHGGLAAALEAITGFTRLPKDELLAVDVAGWQGRVGALLGPVSEAARASAVAKARAGGRGKGLDRRGADLAGADLAGADLRAVILRDALLDRRGPARRGPAVRGPGGRGPARRGPLGRGPARRPVRLDVAAGRGQRRPHDAAAVLEVAPGALGHAALGHAAEPAALGSAAGAGGIGGLIRRGRPPRLSRPPPPPPSSSAPAGASRAPSP